MDPRIILEGIKNATIQTRTQEANYVVWQRQVNQGSAVETLVLPSFSGLAKPGFSAPGGLTVQIPNGNFKSQINSLCLGHWHYPGDFLRPNGPTTHPERPDVLPEIESSAQTAPKPEKHRGWLSRLLGKR